MTESQWMLFSVIIMTVLAVYSIGSQEVYATGTDELMVKMIQVDSKISSLENSDSNFSALTIGKASFEMNQIKKTLLEINEINDRNNDKVNKIYDYLKTNYSTLFEKYQKDVKEYQKENGLTMQEKQLVSELLQNKITFEINETKENFEKTEQELIKITIKDTKAKEDYQKLVNIIGTKLANEANGGITEKISHKIAIKEITSSKTWDLAIPAIDRIINQSNNDDVKEKLVEIKQDIKKLLDKKEKQTNQNQILALKSSEGVRGINLIEFNSYVLENPFILDQIFETELIESLTNSEKIISEFEEKLERDLVLKIEESNTLQIIESIIETELTEVLDDVNEISDDEDNKIDEVREKQRKDASEKKGDNRSDKAKEILKNKENNKGAENSNGNGNSNGNKA